MRPRRYQFLLLSYYYFRFVLDAVLRRRTTSVPVEVDRACPKKYVIAGDITLTFLPVTNL